MIKVFEAFAGVGSQRMALRNLNIPHEVVAISEIDKYAIKSYNAIHGDTYNVGDISKIDVKDIPEHDLFTYSFPCTDISVAGRKQGLTKGSGTGSSLLWECQKVIEYHKPKYLMLENIKNLVGKKFRGDFDDWLEILEKYGYNNYWKVINAKNYGIPQNRERVFVISIRKDVDDGNFEFPQKQELQVRVKDFLENKVEEKFYYSKERTEKLLKTLEEKGLKVNTDKLDCVGEIEISGYDCLKRVYNENGLCPTISTCQGGNTEPKIAFCPSSREYTGFKDVSPTLCARDYKDPKTVIVFEERVYNGFIIRKLTPKECWRLMGFADEDFHKAKQICSNAQLYKQAGNSIVVNVLEVIFKELFKNI